jgi:hypothetical protein
MMSFSHEILLHITCSEIGKQKRGSCSRVFLLFPDPFRLAQTSLTGPEIPGRNLRGWVPEPK